MVSVDEVLERAKNQTITGSVKLGIRGVIIGIGLSVIGTIVEIGQLAIRPLDTLGRALEQVIVGFVIEPLQILFQASTTTQVAFEPGGAFDLGPFTWLGGLAIVLAGAYLLDQYLEQEETSNFVPFAPLDIDPFLRDEENED